MADLYDTTIDNVEIAKIEYEKEMNPFRKMNGARKQGIIQILVSVISAGIILATLIEMQAERNAAYMPNISLKAHGIRFLWDNDHNFNSDTSMFRDVDQEIWEEAASSHTSDYIVDMDVWNTGVGVARDVYIDWHYRENSSAFKTAFSKSDNIFFDMNDEIAWYETKDRIHGVFSSENVKEYQFRFLSADIDKKESIRIPFQYIQLYVYGSSYQEEIDLPVLRFDVIYNDVQGESYRKMFTITPQLEYKITYEEGRGMGIYGLKISEVGTEHSLTINRPLYYVLICIIVVVTFTFMIYICGVIFEKKRLKRKNDESKSSSLSKDDSDISKVQNTIIEANGAADLKE